MSTLKIQTFAPSSHKIKAVIYGASGSGKTHFAATAPRPIFASAEGGLLSTANMGKQIDFVEIKTVEDLRKLLTFLKDEKHEYETVVIDSISEINEIIKEGIERKRGRAMQLQDWGELSKAIKGILRGFRDLPMHTIFIAQESVEKDDQKIQKIVPSLNGKAATEIAYFMDIVGYSYISKTEGHQIMTLPHELYLTKDRSSRIGNDAPPDFTEWENRVKSLELGEQVSRDVSVKTGDDEQPPSAPNAPAKPTAPRQPTGGSEDAKILPEQTKKLFAAWNEYIEISGTDPKKSEAIRKATLKRDFGKYSSTQLTIAEAADFIDRLVKKINELKAKKTPASEPEAPAGEHTPPAPPAPASEPENAPAEPAKESKQTDALVAAAENLFADTSEDVAETDNSPEFWAGMIENTRSIDELDKVVTDLKAHCAKPGASIPVDALKKLAAATKKQRAALQAESNTDAK